MNNNQTKTDAEKFWDKLKLNSFYEPIGSDTFIFYDQRISQKIAEDGKKKLIMNEDQKIDKPTKFTWDISEVIGWFLFTNGVIFMKSSIIWMFQETGSENWFSRMSMSVICFGLSGIIFRLRK